MDKKGLLFLLLLSLGIFMFLSQCANPVSLTGGPRDEQEPQLDTLHSSPNEQTNFEIQDIELYFDEFIEVRDAFKNVVISPPLSKNPKISTRGKKLTIEFDEDEQLKDDATYVINFGEAVRDFTEGNIVKNFRFVFSTGDYIDSLSISGNVVDVKTGKPVEDIFVMLYDNLADTVVRTERPFYFSSTDKDGNFRIENLRSDTFKIFALKDANLNYIYDQEQEMIAFQDDFIFVGDTTEGSYNLEAFVASPEFKLKEKVVPNFGEIKLLFTDNIDDLEYKASIDGIDFLRDMDKDSLLLYFDSPVDTSFNLIVYHPGFEYHDTVSVRKFKRSDFMNKQKFRLRSNSLIGNKLIPSDPLSFNFSHPVSDIDTDSISLVLDSMVVDARIFKYSINPRSILVESDWIADSTYQIVFDGGSVTDIYQRRLDSTAQKFSIVDPDILSNIHVVYNDLDSSTNHVIMIKQGSSILKKEIVSKQSEGKVSFFKLLAKKYDLEVVKDDNQNGKWDPGNYDTKQQSESTFTKELEELRENWDLEVNLSSKDFIKNIVPDTIQ